MDVPLKTTLTKGIGSPDAASVTCHEQWFPELEQSLQEQPVRQGDEEIAKPQILLTDSVACN